MIEKTRAFVVPVAITIIASILHSTIGSSWISFIPAPLFFSIVITWTCRPSWPWLLLGGLTMELLTTLPIGAVSLIIVVPYCIKLIWRRAEANLSIGFLFLIIATTFIQLILLVVTRFGIPSWDIISTKSWLSSLPWAFLGILWLLTSSASFLVCVAIQNWWPSHERSIISLEGRRVLNH